MACDPKNPCDMCKKEGSLAIMLARYAVKPDESKANAASLDDISPRVFLGTTVGYTKRMLRSGYVYLYNPADEEEPWKGYIVTQLGFLLPFRISKTKGPESAPNLEEDATDRGKQVYPCHPTKYVASGYAIVIGNAEKTENIWVCYSDVEWTNAVWRDFDQNKDKCRDKLMRQFNVKNWLDSPKAPHAELIGHHDDASPSGRREDFGLIKIAELWEKTQENEFNFSSTPIQRVSQKYRNWELITDYFGMPKPASTYYPTLDQSKAIDQRLQEEYEKGGEAEKKARELVERATTSERRFLEDQFSRLETSEKTKGRSLVLTLDDPVGITSDLIALMNYETTKFTHNLVKTNPDDLYRKLLANSAIESVRKSVCDEAIIQKRNKPGVITSRMMRSGPVTAAVVLPALVASQPLRSSNRYINSLGTLQPGEYQKVADEAWKEFKEFYDENKIVAFKNEYAEKMGEFNRGRLSWLTKAHAQWLTSDKLADTLTCFYDKNDFDSGKAYGMAVSLCLGTGQEFFETRNIISIWLAGDITDAKNLLLQALVFKQQKAIDAVVKFTKDTDNKSIFAQFPFWENFSGTLLDILDKDLDQGNGSVLRLLLKQCSGVIQEQMLVALRSANPEATRLAASWAVTSVYNKVVMGLVAGRACPEGFVNFAGNRIYYSVDNIKGGGPGTVFKLNMINESCMQIKPGDNLRQANFWVTIDMWQADHKMTDADYDKLLTNITKETVQKRSPYFSLAAIDAIQSTASTGVNVFAMWVNLTSAASALEAYRKADKLGEIVDEDAKKALIGRFHAGILLGVGASLETAESLAAQYFGASRLSQGLGLKLSYGVKLMGKTLAGIGSGYVAYRDVLETKEAISKGKDEGLIAACMASVIIDVAFTFVAVYTLLPYLRTALLVIRNRMTLQAAFTAMGSGALAAEAIPFVNVLLLVLFLCSMELMSYKAEREQINGIKEWLSRCIFYKEDEEEENDKEKIGKKKKDPPYKDIKIEQAAAELKLGIKNAEAMVSPSGSKG